MSYTAIGTIHHAIGWIALGIELLAVTPLMLALDLLRYPDIWELLGGSEIPLRILPVSL